MRCWCLHPKIEHDGQGCLSCMITRLNPLQWRHRFRPLGEHRSKKKLFDTRTAR